MEDAPRPVSRNVTELDDRVINELSVDAPSAEPEPKDQRADDRVHAHVHGATLCILWAFALGLSALGVVWLYHMIAPEKYCFLSDVQKSKLDLVLLTVMTTLFVTDRATRGFKS